jgi:hypothetical protein
MQVHSISRAPGRRADPSANRFAMALRAARDAWRRGEPPLEALRILSSPAALRRSHADRKDASLHQRRDGFAEVERQAAPSGAPPPPAPVDPPPPAELRAAVRAIPPAVEAARIREGVPLVLSFGRALSVDLRSGPAGLEVLLRPEASLARAASAELPGLVAALRARGVRVAHADVRPRSRPAGATAIALTPPGASDTKAVRHGTVAKW